MASQRGRGARRTLTPLMARILVVAYPELDGHLRASQQSQGAKHRGVAPDPLRWAGLCAGEGEQCLGVPRGALSLGGAPRRARPRGGRAGSAAQSWRLRPGRAWIGGQWWGRPCLGPPLVKKSPGLRAETEVESGHHGGHVAAWRRGGVRPRPRGPQWTPREDCATQEAAKEVGAAETAWPPCIAVSWGAGRTVAPAPREIGGRARPAG
ncbi:hypothetical protein NDU88_000751 [Pleurodeles waltl]|uniref:Uncharacterized protein n=1 Tax=Pleurodeles waltl TaxID=8319 RepID=A0AAV7WGE1_PLEWA|nr:hypothetical protein NDU88_000751 [Pleurodeles waltl]